MKLGILIIIVAALIFLMVLFLNKGQQANPVAQGMAGLDKAKIATMELDMNTISAAITNYFGNFNEYPENLEMLVPKYLPSTNSILDSWGNPLRLEKDNQQNLYLVSAGPDRAFATGDDIKRRL
jgi:hypothetical protein